VGEGGVPPGVVLCKGESWAGVRMHLQHKPALAFAGDHGQVRACACSASLGTSLRAPRVLLVMVAALGLESPPFGTKERPDKLAQGAAKALPMVVCVCL